MSVEIKIVEFDDEWSGDFAALNYEWIETYFEVEKHDREILDDPHKWVIDAGGQIFMAVADHRGVGTVALIPAGDAVLELTKMAVSPEFRGHGIGDRLMEAALEHARASGYEKVFLETHHKLAPALALYRKHGFVDIPTDPNSQYARADVRMEILLGGK